MASRTSIFANAMRRKDPTRRLTSPVVATTAPRKTLTLFDLTLLGIGGTLGSGLFLLTGHAARDIAGPAISLSFALAALACLPSALAYAELSSRFPTSGGAYVFVYAALGEWPAFLVGMCLTLEYGVSVAAVARSWASYVGDAIHGLPPWATGRDSLFCVLAFVLMLAVTAVLSVGLHHAKWVINAGTLLYSAVVITVIATGTQTVRPENWTPFFPYGTTGAVAGASAVFFAYLGFDEIAIVSDEAVNAARDVPLAIVLALLFVSTVYIAASLVLTGTVPFNQLDVDAPFSAAMRTAGHASMALVVCAGTALGMTNTAVVTFAAQPRLFVAMARDGLLPRALAASTTLTTVGCGLAVALIALVVRTEMLAEVVSGGTLLAFLATNVSLLLTRARARIGREGEGRAPSVVLMFVCVAAATAAAWRLAGDGMMPVWVSTNVGLSATSVLAVRLLLLRDAEFTCVVRPVHPGYSGDADALSEASAMGSSVGLEPMFTCPGVPALPLVGTFATVFLLFQLRTVALVTLLSLMGVSTLFYVTFGAWSAGAAKAYREIGR